MEKKHFEGFFNVLDYNISHKVLKIQGNVENNPYPQTNMVFNGVFYLEISTRFRTGITLYQADPEMISLLTEKCNEKVYPQFGNTFYVIEADNKKYFIGCTGYQIDLIESSAMDNA